MKKIPVGIENFKEIIDNQYYYIDKTELINDVMNEKLVLYTRPVSYTHLMMKDLGIGEEDQIQSLSLAAMDICKLVLDDEIEVKLPIEEYLSGNRVEKIKQDDGTYSIVVKDINEVIVK